MADRYWVGNGTNTAWFRMLACDLDSNYVHWNYEMQNASSYVLQFRGV